MAYSAARANHITLHDILVFGEEAVRLQEPQPPLVSKGAQSLWHRTLQLVPLQQHALHACQGRHLPGHGPRKLVPVEPEVLQGHQVGDAGRYVPRQVIGREVQMIQQLQVVQTVRYGPAQSVVRRVEVPQPLQSRHRVRYLGGQRILVQYQGFQVPVPGDLPRYRAAQIVAVHPEMLESVFLPQTVVVVGVRYRNRPVEGVVVEV
mmetsp:Transcript_6467/g.13500  ORF Transcript_6467/g.13500 Transcript_6467/m.13500 type:complete len:205 (+) Transcript_6467:964-1578(+)